MARLPGPGLLELARLGPDTFRHPADVATQLRARHGDVVRFGYKPMSYVMLFGLEANEMVLGERHGSFTWGEAMRTLEVVDGPTALVLTDGDEHKRRRRLVQPAFATRRVDGSVPLMIEEIDRVIDSLQVGETVDLFEHYTGAVRRIVTRVLFGEELGDRADELGAALEPALHFIGRPPQLTYRGVPGHRRARRSRRRADEIVDAEIARRRSSGALGDDILGALLQTELTDAELRDQVVSLVAAGYHTTSGAVGFAVLELLRRPGVWSATYDEVADRLGDHAPTGDDLRNLPYVQGVVHETLRLWPAPFLGRIAQETFSYRGHTIPAGTAVVFSPFVTQRDPAVWGADALDFRPERWIGADPAPYSFITFGGSYRKCIGFALATTELTAVVTRLVQRTTLSLADPALAAAERGTGMAAMHPQHGVRVVVESVDAKITV